jgi:hypothetical protein
MDDVILDAQAAENGLAIMLQGLLSENLAASEKKRRDFSAMSSTFGLVAPDAEVTVTLVFTRGRCVIYDGLRKDLDLVITADSGQIPELSLVRMRYGLPWLFDDSGQKLIRALWSRSIRVDGLFQIPPTPLKTLHASTDLVRLMRILSVAS